MNVAPSARLYGGALLPLRYLYFAWRLATNSFATWDSNLSHHVEPSNICLYVLWKARTPFIHFDGTLVRELFGGPRPKTSPCRMLIPSAIQGRSGCWTFLLIYRDDENGAAHDPLASWHVWNEITHTGRTHLNK